MKRIKVLLIMLCLACSASTYAQSRIIDIAPPAGYERQDADAYGTFLRNLPLKPAGTPVRLYDGTVKSYQDGAHSVIDMEIGTRDLQQCADAVMRLRAEFLWHKKQYDKIHFNFTSGFRADYVKWAEGYRISVKGNSVSWYEGAEEDYSYATFRKYMNIVFMYAGTASLSNELAEASVSDLKIGDVFIIGGHPGHAMVIVDMACDKHGNKAILVAQSYMPAQDIHIVTNLGIAELSPWYIINSNTTAIRFPEYSFSINDLKRF